jgi:hypothetical protein
VQIDESKRHQADYDILITKKLLDKITIDIAFDLERGEYSEIQKISNIENSINEKIEYIKTYPKSNKTIEFLHSI